MRPSSRGTSQGTPRSSSGGSSCGFAFGDGVILLQLRHIVGTSSDQQIAEQAFGFHDVDVGLFGNGDEVVGHVAFYQAIVTPVKGNPDLVNTPVADLQRSNSRRGKCLCFNRTARRD